MALIRTENLTKYFNKGKTNEILAINNVSIEIDEGDFAVFKGPSGSGKTTILSIIGCMSRPTHGAVIINGKNVSHLPERFMADIRRKTFGFVFQQFHLIRGLTVCENVMLPLLCTETSPSILHKMAEDILKGLEMEDRMNFRIENLSAGQQQRTAIARALINDPEIIIADEPTAHLDTKMSEDFLSIMRGLQKRGKTIIIATHDPLVYEKNYITKIFEIRDGEIKTKK